MSLRMRLARLLIGELPHPDVHQLHDCLLLQPRIGRVAAPRVCWPKVHGGMVPAIGGSTAVTRVRWTSLEPAIISPPEPRPLFFLPAEVKVHSNLPQNLTSVGPRVLEERGGLPEVHAPHIGHPGDACSIPAAAEAQPEHDKERCGEASGQFTQIMALSDRCSSLVEVPNVPPDRQFGKGAESIVAFLESSVPTCETSDSRDGGVPQPIEDSIEATTRINNVSLGVSSSVLRHEQEVATPEGDELREELRTPRAPTYRPPRPPRTKPRPLAEHDNVPRSKKLESESGLRLRVQLVFGRGGCVKRLALVPDRREGMPSEVQVAGAEGQFHLADLRDDCYEPVPLANMGNALLRGVDWYGRGDASHWRWVLGGRQLYVLAPGDEFGLHGFVSTSRLSLHAPHVVLATASYRREVLAALDKAGCMHPEVNDETTSGVPQGWLLFRDVTPTRAVLRRDEETILNALCPSHDVEPHFVGGIRLERRTWLIGFPPRIRFTGEISAGYQITIDGHSADPATDGAYESPGWDATGTHCIWYGDKTVGYELRQMEEHWEAWHANIGAGAVICGAGTYPIDDTRSCQVRISTTNPLLVGARPGQIFRCPASRNFSSSDVVVLVPFTPVWALPANPSHADKRCARVVLINAGEPSLSVDHACSKRITDRALRDWITVINDAGRKRLLLTDTSEETGSLWQRYRIVAKQLWRKTR